MDIFADEYHVSWKRYQGSKIDHAWELMLYKGFTYETNRTEQKFDMVNHGSILLKVYKLLIEILQYFYMW